MGCYVRHVPVHILDVHMSPTYVVYAFLYAYDNVRTRLDCLKDLHMSFMVCKGLPFLYTDGWGMTAYMATLDLFVPCMGILGRYET